MLTNGHTRRAALCALLTMAVFTWRPLSAQTLRADITSDFSGNHAGTAIATGYSPHNNGLSCGFRKSLVLGSPGALGGKGRVEIYESSSGEPHDWTLVGVIEGHQTGNEFGFSVSADGNLDVDAPDYAVGAPGTNGGTGKVRVYSSGDCNTPPASLTYWTASGSTAGERFGHAVLIIPDVDGDGYDDVLVSAPLRAVGVFFPASEAGAVHLYSGHTGTLIRTHFGGTTSGHFGWSVASVGDLDGDSIEDYAVGEPGHDVAHGPQALTDAGRVHVFSGASGVSLPQLATTGPSSGAQYGWSIANAGDLDRDGVDDILVGAPGYDIGVAPFLIPDAGRFEVRSGADGSPIVQQNGTGFLSRTGAAVKGGADTDLDGYPDLLVGAPGSGGHGRVQLLSGRDLTAIYDIAGQSSGAELGASLELTPHYFTAGRPGHAGDRGGAMRWATRVDWTLTGGPHSWGGSVALLHDVDGDGWDDFAIARYSEAVSFLLSHWTIRSGRTSTVIYEESSPAAFGNVISSIGDVDGDGVDDMVVCRPAEALFEVRSGADPSAFIHARSGRPSTLFGHAVSPIGDLDGDGVADYIVAAPRADSGTLVDAGRVDVFSGAHGGLIRSHSGTEPFGELGRSVAGLGDVDGDGVPDYGAGAPFTFSPSATDLGMVVIWSGVDGSLIMSRSGGTLAGAGPRLGFSLCGPGDVNGDGFADIVVGEPRQNALMVQAGRVRVFAGGPATVAHPELYVLEGTFEGALFGEAVSAVGDVDRDGVGDFAVVASASAAPYSDPEVSIISGATGTEISHRSIDEAAPDGTVSLSSRVLHADGRHEVVAGYPENVSGEGAVTVLMLPEARRESLGGACSNAAVTNPPGLGSLDLPILGRQMTLNVGNLPYSPTVQDLYLYFSGPPAMPLDLGGGCLLHIDLATAADVTIPFQYGETAFPFFIPEIGPLAGLSMHAQAFAADPMAPLGFAFTNGLNLVFGF